MSSIKNVFETLVPKGEARDVVHSVRPGFTIDSTGRFTVPMERERKHHLYHDPEAKNASWESRNARYHSIARGTI